MALTADIKQLVDAAGSAVDSDSDHQLRPILRSRIYEALAAKPLVGVAARIWLDVLTARYVAPLWTAEHADDRMDDLIELAEGVLRGAIDTKTAAVKAGHIWEWLSNDYEQRTEELSDQALFTLSVAVEALFAAAGHDRFEEVVVEEQDTDDDLDPWCSDAASYAAYAIAGRIGAAPSDAAKRRAFWMWWLLEALPKAWELASEPSSK